MKKIALFCIPACGHTNPLLAVARELVRRGNEVRFYSFTEFREKILATGASFVACDAFLPDLNRRELAGLRRVSVTAMTVQDLRITGNMDGFLGREMKAFAPDVICADSACFWGKLTAWKYRIPLVVSTSTLAFNEASSRYMKNSPRETADLVLGLPRVSRELKKLAPLGYRVKNVLSLVQSGNDTDAVVYTSRRFQPYARTFSPGRYAFVGPSVSAPCAPRKEKARPLVYVSLGTVLAGRTDFFVRCIRGLENVDADVVLSCGRQMDLAALGTLPGNVRAYPFVDQLEVLSRADVFVTHCGMNSVSESLYMATPMVLYPQTGEEYAVAQRTAELGAGVLLRDDSAAGIARAVREVLEKPACAEAAAACSRDFRSCPGAAGAAAFIEAAPHDAAEESGVLPELHRRLARFSLLYWGAVALSALLCGLAFGAGCRWLPAALGGVLYGACRRRATDRLLKKLAPSA